MTNIAAFLMALATVESGNEPLGIHTDGLSAGRYGITRIFTEEVNRRLGYHAFSWPEDAIHDETARLVVRTWHNSESILHPAWTVREFALAYRAPGRMDNPTENDIKYADAVVALAEEQNP